MKFLKLNDINIVYKHCQREFNFNIVNDIVARRIKYLKFDIASATTCFVSPCENIVHGTVVKV